VTAAGALAATYAGLCAVGGLAALAAALGGARTHFAVGNLAPTYAALVLTPLAYEAARRLGGAAGLDALQARWAAGGLAVLALYAILSDTARSVLAQAALIALPLGALAWALLDSLVDRMTSDAAVAGQGAPPTLLFGAVITGSVVALGWVFTYALQEYRRADERAQAVDDLLDALRAEIVDYLTDEARGKLDRSMPDTLARITGEPGFVPFVPSGRGAVVFDALKDRLHLMPSAATDPVVQFYVQLQDIHVMSKDLQSEPFRNLPADRMAAAYREFMELRTDADALAKRALAAILTEQRQFPTEVFAQFGVGTPDTSDRPRTGLAFSNSRSGATDPPPGAGSGDRGTEGRGALS
jgi:hypothetical protein